MTTNVDDKLRRLYALSNNLINKIDLTDDKVGTTAVSVASQNDQISTLQQSILTQSSRIDGLTKTLSDTIMDYISRFASEDVQNGLLLGMINAVQPKLDTLDTKISAVQPKLDTINGRLNSDYNQLSQLSNASASLDSRLYNLSSRVDVNTSSITTLNTTVNGLLTAVPIGTVVNFPSSSNIPSGWLALRGQSISRSTYGGLFGIIGTTYGSVDGNSFTLPNCDSRVIVGVSSTFGMSTVGGEQNHTLTVGEMPIHNHSVTDNGHMHTIQNCVNQGNAIDYSPNVLTRSGANGISYSQTYGTTSNVSVNNNGGGAAHNNMQPYIVMIYLIKF